MNRNTPKDKSSRSKVLNFHCADVMPNCDWRFSGASEEEILLAIEQHGREEHNLTVLDDETKKKMLNAIRRQPAQKIAA